MTSIMLKKDDRENMMEEVKIEVAGACIMLRSDAPDLLNRVREEYALFLSGGIPSLVMDITPTEERYVNDSSWAGLAVTGDTLRLSDNYLESTINVSLRSGSALVSWSGLMIGLSTLLRNIFTLLLLLKQNAIILHAAAIVRNDRVYIFMGHSGSGKSTVSTLSQDCTVLSDDMAILKQANSSYHVFPSPFWLDMQRGVRENRGYKIGGIFKLVQDKHTYVKKIPPSQAMADIFTIPHIPVELQPIQNLFDAFSSILHEHDLYEMHFTKDTSFWRHIDERAQQIST